MHLSESLRLSIVHLIYACIAALLVLVGSSPLLFAQADTATVSGAVVDATGAYIPGATVLLQDTATGTEAKTSTNQAGVFSLNGIQPGHYELSISKVGFATVKLQNIVLNVGDHRTFEIKLKAGAEQSVNVDASGITLNTTDASVGTVIDRKFVENAPLNGRSFQDLISMTPGVVTASPQTTTEVGYSGDFSVNGQRTESNYYTVDGVSGNVGAGNGAGVPQAATSGGVSATTALGTTQSLVSVDALQEFRVQSSTYSAEYGRTPGGQFSLVTRSGTNEFHGSAFDYLRNNFFDANNWFNDLNGKPTAALRQNDFGGTLGGAIGIPRLYDGKGRSFFFVSYEGLRLVLPQAAAIQYVPSPSLRSSVPSFLQPILDAFPVATGAEIQVPCSASTTACPSGVATGTPVPSGLAPFVAPFSLPSHVNSTSIRIDHKISDKLVLFFRFGDTPSYAETRTLSALSQVQFNTLTYTVGATSQLSKKLTNQLRVGYSDSLSSQSGQLDSFGGASPIDFFNALVPNASSVNREPYVGFTISGVGSSDLSTPSSNNENRQWNIVNTLSISHGKHQLSIGGDYRHIRSNLDPASTLVEALFFNKYAAENNLATDVALQQRLPASPLFNELAIFGQDEWRVAPQLSLSVGLRWEIDPPPTEAHGNDAFTLVGSISNPSSLTLATRGTPLWKATYYNFAPRIGLAWTAYAAPRWETVIRTGGGIFFDTDDQVAASGYTTSAIGFGATQIIANTPLPVTGSQLNFFPSINPPFTSSSAYAFPQHLQLPYTLQWNASLEQALGGTQALTVSYVASASRRLLGEQLLSVHALNPNFSNVYYLNADLTANYQSLQVQFQRSVSRGIQSLASYTWSHSLDFGSNDSTLPFVRGNSDFDVRHNFSGGLSWELPALKDSQFIETVLNHWSLDGRIMLRTGFPVNLQGNTALNPATGIEYYSGVNLIPGEPFYLYGNQCSNLPGSICPGGRIINKAAFAAPLGTAVGNAPRNFIRGFGLTQVNLAARRDIRIGDGPLLQFRAETFNALNHPNFGYVDPLLTDATFGQATQTLNSSLGTMASQYQQGGPRSMQFALKLLF